MALPAVGQAISLSQIQTEFGGSNPISLSEYYGKGNAPGSGAITMSADFGGTDNTPPSPITYTTAGSTATTIASNVRAIGVQIIGAGGGGAGARGTTGNFFGTGGGGAGGNIIAYFNVSGGETLTGIRGTRGSGGTGTNVGSGGGNSSVTVNSTTVATGNGGGGGQGPGGGSGGGTSSNGSAYNVTANTGASGTAGSGQFGFVGGAGASSPEGSGGSGTSNGNGGNASGNGAGGGGAGSSSTAQRTGGLGSHGYVKITFYTSANPTPDLSF